MEHLASRDDDQFHSYINKPSITRAQLTPKPPTRDISFSNYLQTEAKKPVQCAQDSEISIFDADKYYNGVQQTLSNPKRPDIPTTRRLSLSTPKQSVSSVSRLSSVSDESYGRNYRARSFHATPTASSEASWNSQTGLLTNPPGLAPVSIRNIQITGDRTSKKPAATPNWFLRGNICPCTGKKALNVKTSNSETETSKIPPTPPRIVQLNRISSSGYLYRPQLDQNKLMLTATNPNPNPNLSGLHRDQSFLPNGFSFPILCEESGPTKRTVNIGKQDDAGETPRDSIEVFQPKESPKSRRASYDDGYCSDASSDLFEIESFSTTTAVQTFPFPRRDSLEDPAANFHVRRLRIAAFNRSADEDADEPVTPSIAPTECYAPSEVSVDWSVTTAEGFDRASVAGFSESGYAGIGKPPKFGSGADESKRKGSGGGLLTSCRCEKAVNVGPAPVNTRRSHEYGRPQPPVAKPSRSTLMPVPFVAEHRHSL